MAVGGGVIDGVAVGVGVTDGVMVGVAVGVADGVGDGGTDGVTVGVGVGLGVAPAAQKSSIEAIGTAVASYPPASQMRLVPSVSVGKFRRPVTNGSPVVQLLLPGS